MGANARGQGVVVAGRRLCASRTPRGWRVEMRGRSAERRHLDEALAEVLGAAYVATPADLRRLLAGCGYSASSRSASELMQ